MDSGVFIDWLGGFANFWHGFRTSINLGTIAINIGHKLQFRSQFAKIPPALPRYGQSDYRSYQFLPNQTDSQLSMDVGILSQRHPL